MMNQNQNLNEERNDSTSYKKGSRAIINKYILNILCVVFLLVTLGILLWSCSSQRAEQAMKYQDNIEKKNPNTTFLKDSGVQVDFSEVILSKQQESRKLIVSEQTGTVSTELTDRIIQKLDFDFMKKTQTVTYTGKGYFVVDLDKLTKDDVIDDSKNKQLTIRIDHAHLEAIEIDPNEVQVGDVKQSLLARGDIELSLKDYNVIEKELMEKLEAQFNTVKNGQDADELALKKVKEVYEPVVKAIDKQYIVVVEFK